MSEGRELALQVIDEVEKAVVGKRKILEKIMTAILAGGHILIEDIPGTGKTTMALAFSRAMRLKETRVQFTPDVLPADLTGFTIYQKETGQFVYQPGAVMCNILLADEINRTSPKTQSALLEVMEEKQVTVDGVTRQTGDPFIVIATENPVGSAGTQLLPESQLDRFMICVKMGYPSVEEEIEILRRVQSGEAVENIFPILERTVLLLLQKEVREVFVHERIYRYIAELAKATRENEWTELGIFYIKIEEPWVSSWFRDKIRRIVIWQERRWHVWPVLYDSQRDRHGTCNDSSYWRYAGRDECLL